MGNSDGGLVRLLAQARQAFERNAWEDAGERYRLIVQSYPECAEAWFWLGVLGLRIGDPGTAAVFLEQAHELGLKDPACLSNLGEAYRRSGNLEAARQVLEQACEQAPRAFAPWFNLASMHAEAQDNEAALDALVELERNFAGNLQVLLLKAAVLKNAERNDEAERYYRRVLDLHPTHPEATLGLADTLRLKQDYVAAMEVYEGLLRRDARNLGALNGLAGVAVGLQDEKGAEHFYRQALEIAPDCWESLLGLGMELTSRHRFEDAIEVLSEATRRHPDKEEGWMRLGEAYFHAERFDEALQSYQAALARNPSHVSSLTGVGNVHVHGQRWEEAIVAYRKAYELAPEDYRVRSNIGQAYYGNGDSDQAEAWAAGAVGMLDDDRCDPFVRFNLSVIDLSRGNLERGWRGYDYRDSLEKMRGRFPYPFWQGESLSGKRILLWQDQGIGDQLVFATLFNELIALAGEVVIECEPKLFSLTRRTFPRAIVVPRAKNPHPLTLDGIDFQCASGSLPRWLRPSIAAFPAEPPQLLRLDTARCAYWQERLQALSDLPKIGVCWRSSLRTGLRKLCYADIEDWAPVFSMRGVTFVNLQYDECREELNQIADLFGTSLSVFPELDMFNDLDESCAMISGLDAVVSAPTTVAWQAGSVMVPTSRLTLSGDWLSLGCKKNPWMPNVVSYKKEGGNGWSVPLKRIANDLKTRFGLPE